MTKLKLFLEKTSCYLIQELDIRFSGQHVLAPIIVQTINISGVILYTKEKLIEKHCHSHHVIDSFFGTKINTVLQ